MLEQSKNTSVSKIDLYSTAAAVLSLVLVVQISVVTKQQWLQIAALCLVIVTQMIFGITALRAKKAATENI